MGKYLQIFTNIYRWTLGPKKKGDPLLFLDQVEVIKNPAGLVKIRGPFGSPFLVEEEVTIVSQVLCTVCTYSSSWPSRR